MDEIETTLGEKGVIFESESATDEAPGSKFAKMTLDPHLTGQFRRE
ncbi:MAG: hypothetical protein HYT08_02410 [Candidatus Levybacteria bacterium]|nr:hypothetical protein [Candidatus Levybacteria bacterium]